MMSLASPPASAFKAAGAEVWIQGIEIVKFALILGEDVRIDLQVMGARDSFNAAAWWLPG